VRTNSQGDVSELDTQATTRVYVGIYAIYWDWIHTGRVHLVRRPSSPARRGLDTDSVTNRYFPTLLYYASIPVLKNAPVLTPTTSDRRWPVMIFSHGLGGSRNAYSHLAGSIASHGVIVIAPEHRDGSAPISYIRDVPSANSSDEKSTASKAKRTMGYNRISHTPSPEVEAGRNAQLKIRLFEISLIHDSLLRIDLDQPLTNLNTSSAPLAMFKEMMNVHEPGKITFAGHSFGATTMTQFVKSTFYGSENGTTPEEYEPLFAPSSRSSIVEQITPNTPVVLLDVWCLPLRSAATRWLWNKPFPCYTEGGPGGEALLSVGSQAFYKWRVHLKATKRLLSPHPTSDDDDYKQGDGSEWARPHFYYVANSAHLSQSDFGVLFPWFTRRILSAKEPERVVRLNTRAILQLMRARNIEVSATSAADMELAGQQGVDTKNDTLIFGAKDAIRAWNWISTDVNDLSDVDYEAETQIKVDKKGRAVRTQSEVVGSELAKQVSGTSEPL
jgi:platelet-activating factor acetylhydrolase